MFEATTISVQLKGTQILKQISHSFNTGMIYSILGPNGSGKTTFLKVLAGLIKPAFGTVSWKGQNMASLSRKEKSLIITLVPQSPELHFDFSVEQLVLMGRYVHKDQHKRNKVAPFLALVNALHLRHRLVKTLSSGERQRVYIARSLMTDAPVMLFDEPTACLDIKHQLEIWQLLSDLKSLGKIIIVANHDLSIAKEISDEILTLQAGILIESNIAAKALSATILEKVFGVRELNGRYFKS
jgi:ABC-type cobalamin/Fe3+-siderophores transport system ATPase subunit